MPYPSSTLFPGAGTFPATLQVVANPSYTPPRFEITCKVPPGDVMQTATLNRVVGGVSEPVLSQPGTGLDTQLVYDYFAPYGVPVSYEFVSDYLNPVGALAWDETWANLSAWSGATSSFAVASGKASCAASTSSEITRAVPLASYRVVVASLTSTETGNGIVFPWLAFESAAAHVLTLSPTADGGIAVPNGAIFGAALVATGLSGSAPLTIDFLGTSVTISGTRLAGGAGSYTISGLTSTDFQTVSVNASFPSYPGTLTVGEVKITGYPATSHTDELSAPVTLNVSQAWLIHPANPSLSVPISSSDQSAIAVQTLGDITNASASTLHQILGEALAIETHSGPRFGNAQQIVLKARTRAQELALMGILADSTSLLFRFPPSYDAGFDEGFYSFGQVQRSRIAQRTGLPLRALTANITEVQTPTVIVQSSGWSWAQLAAEFSTWADVSAAFATWADVLTNNRKPGY